MLRENILDIFFIHNLGYRVLQTLNYFYPEENVHKFTFVRKMIQNDKERNHKFKEMY